MRRLLATRLPRQSLFTGASDVADAVFVTEPRKASDQAASKGGKVGPSTLQCMCFDPTSDGRVWRALVPSRELASAAADAAPPRLMAGVMVNTSMKGAPETNRKSGVRPSRRRSQPDPVSLWACCCGVCEPRTSLCLWKWRRARTSNLARWRADPHEHSYKQGAGPVGSRRRAAG